MACRGCSSKFTLFNKEHGCPNCGFSHCNKCLKYNAVVPKLGEKEVKVCGPCYNFYIRKGNEKSTKDEYSPPESFMSSENSSSSSLLPSVPSDINYSSSSTGIDSESSAREMLDQPIVRRLESLENPARPPITLYRQDSRLQKLKAGLNETDREIAERLEKLKEERKKQPPPSEEEMARRLALLKGEDPDRMAAHQSNKKAYLPPDNRSDQEKAEGLMQQYLEENELASQLPDSADEIAERLAKLRATGTPSSSAVGKRKNFGLPSVIPSNVDDEFSLSTMQEVRDSMVQLAKQVGVQSLEHKNALCKSMEQKEEECSDENVADDEEVENTIKKAFEAVALEQKLEEEELEDSDDKKKVQKEFPWCIICNDNAAIRCIDCDDDLYCKQCFKQGHDEWDLKDHKFVPFKKSD